MWRILFSLLVVAAFARAQSEERRQTAEEAVRHYLATASDEDLPRDRLSEWLVPTEPPPSDETGTASNGSGIAGTDGEHQEATQPPHARKILRDYLFDAVDLKDWDFTAALGFTLTSGNSDSVTLLFGAEGKREWELWKLGMKIGILYAESDGNQTASEWIFIEKLERKLSERATIFQLLLLEHDEEEDLAYRIQLTFGYNRRLVKKEKFELWGNVGAGVLYESFFDDTRTQAIAQLGINFTWQITKTLKYTQVLTFFPSLSDGGEFRMYWESVFETPISDHFNLRFSIIDRYDSNPQPGVKDNDLTIGIALAVKFTKAPPKE